jgi:RNA polymerase-associated protein
MTLFVKAGPDGTSVGDCPFAHAVRLVLEEKGLSYDIQPCTSETKPDWLVESYEGKMPALRHRKECYVESSVIMEYLEFFFRKPVSLKADRNTESVLDGFFPAVADYLKEDKGEDSEDSDKLVTLQEKLLILEDHLGSSTSTGPFLCGDAYSLLDCRLVPQLYHLQTAGKEYKGGVPNLAEEYPNVSKYYETTTARPSFANTVYAEETVIWGWGNARN